MPRRAFVLLLLLALFSGCVEKTRDAAASGCDPNHSMSTQTHRFNDVVVIGRAYHEAGLHCFYGEVVNEGARTTLNNPDACPEWERRLYDADGRSVPIEPGYGCAAVITPITLEAGEHLRFETLWNETRYDEPSRTFGPLDPGTYRWEIRFRPPEARTSFEYEVLVE